MTLVVKRRMQTETLGFEIQNFLAEQHSQAPTGALVEIYLNKQSFARLDILVCTGYCLGGCSPKAPVVRSEGSGISWQLILSAVGLAESLYSHD